MTRTRFIAILADMTWAWVALAILTATAVGLWLALKQHGLAMALWFMRKTFPEVPRVPPHELAAWLADSARPAPVLLDVRTPEEFAVSHLPGAVRCDCSAGVEAIMSLLPKSRPAVVYCAAGFRAAKVARRLARAGAREVYNLEGSIFAWAKAGLPLESDGRPAATVHPFNALGKQMLGGK